MYPGPAPAVSFVGIAPGMFLYAASTYACGPHTVATVILISICTHWEATPGVLTEARTGIHYSDGLALGDPATEEGRGLLQRRIAVDELTIDGHAVREDHPSFIEDGVEAWRRGDGRVLGDEFR